MSESGSAQLINEFVQALSDEIEALEKIENPYILVRFQQQIAYSDKQHWYVFKANHSVSILKDTPCQIHYQEKDYAVYVVGGEGTSIILSSYNQLPKMSGFVRLERGAIVLVKRLVQCLLENKDRPNPIGMRMFPTNGSIYSATQIADFDMSILPKSNTLRQNQAIFSSLTNDISYLWGLPGSGKTTVIGQIIQHLYQQDRSVLVVSHTNTAVDGALEKAFKHIDPDRSLTVSTCPILRIGTPAKKLPHCLLLREQAKSLNQELSTRHDTLSAKQKQLESRQKELSPYLNKYGWFSKTKLSEMKAVQASILNVVLEKEKLEKARSVLLEQLADASKQYEAMADCTSLQIALEREKRNLSAICSAKTAKQDALRKNQDQIRIARDELKKHEKYAALHAEEMKYFSKEYYQQTLKTIQTNIDALAILTQDLKRQRDNAQSTIEAYYRMNSFQKLFASKSKLEKAVKNLTEAEYMLSQKKAELSHQKQLHADTSAALHEIHHLHDKMHLVQPTKTQTIWEQILKNAQNEELTLHMQIEECNSTEIHVQSAIQIFSVKYAESGQALSHKKDCENAVAENHRKILLCEQNQAELEHQYQQLVAEERKLYCDAFNVSNDIPSEQLLGILDAQLLVVKSELDSINAENVPQEYDENCKTLANIYQQITEVELALDDTMQQIIKEAPIIGTTLTTSYINATLRGRKFDTVILDEASFASIPALWCATLLADKNVVIVGDFMQLPPIVNANSAPAKKWLGKDVFWHSRMQELAKKTSAVPPKNFIMLNDQFRMESAIAQIANLYYTEYGGIRSHDNLRENARDVFYDWFPGPKTSKSVHILDTQKYGAWTTRDLSGSSRLNRFTASINVAMAFHFIDKILRKLDKKTAIPVQEPKVLIIAQYAHHIECIKQLIELEYNNLGFTCDLNYIQAGTVHSFQGMEADIVIFDLVLDEPDQKAMLFKQETNDLEIKRMLNVAVTRARFQLFIVGNFEFCLKHAEYNAFADFLNYILRYHKEDFSNYLPNMNHSHCLELATHKVLYCNEITFADYFYAEIQQMHSEMTIYSPYITEKRLKQFLPIFREAIAKGKKIRVVTKAPSCRDAAKLDLYKNLEQQLQDIGVSVHHNGNMHEKLIFVDQGIAWSGSLNVLSYTGRTTEFMMRSVGLDFAKKQQLRTYHR